MMFADKLLTSTYFAATVWLTVLARTGQNKGPRMKGCCRSSPGGKVDGKVLMSRGTIAAGTGEVSEITWLVLVRRTFSKLETNEETTQFNLHWYAGCDMTQLMKKEMLLCWMP